MRLAENPICIRSQTLQTNCCNPNSALEKKIHFMLPGPGLKHRSRALKRGTNEGVIIPRVLSAGFRCAATANFVPFSRVIGRFCPPSTGLILRSLFRAFASRSLLLAVSRILLCSLTPVEQLLSCLFRRRRNNMLELCGASPK